MCRCATVSDMTTALERAYFLLREDMYEYLDAVEEYTDETNFADDETILLVARAHLPHLISIARCALRNHVRDDSGICKSCSAAWPCDYINELCRFAATKADITDADFSSNR